VVFVENRKEGGGDFVDDVVFGVGVGAGRAVLGREQEDGGAAGFESGG